MKRELIVIWGGVVKKVPLKKIKKRHKMLMESSQYSGSPCPCSGC